MKVDQAIEICQKVGRYDLHSDPECQEGTPLGDAYSKGWNAALDEMIGRLRAVIILSKAGGKGDGAE